MQTFDHNCIIIELYKSEYTQVVGSKMPFVHFRALTASKYLYIYIYIYIYLFILVVGRYRR